MNLLVFYLLFVMVSLLIVSYLITKLHVPRPLWLTVGIGFLVVSPIVISYLYVTYVAPLPEVKVPELSMLTISEAQAKLQKFGLKARVAERAYERKVPDGRVISQRPEAGRLVKLGRVVNLKVSIGKRMVLVPNLVGRPLSQIEIVLTEAGLKIGKKRTESTEQFQSGVVMGQTPAPDEEVPIGSEVDVLIAENPNFGTITVPNLVSKTLEEARETASALKLKLVIYYHKTREFKKDTVISQDPVAGEEARMGGTVKVFSATPPEETTPEER